MLRSLLQRVPEKEREAAIKSVIESVGDNGSLDIGLTLSLFEQLESDGSRDALQTCLLAQLEAGRIDVVVAVSGQHGTLHNSILDQVAARLYRFASHSYEPPAKEIAAHLDDVVPLMQGNPIATVGEDVAQATTTAARHLLTFVKSAFSIRINEDTFDRLFKASLLLLGSVNHVIAVGARETLVKLFGVSERMTHAHHQLVWLCLQRLITQKSSSFHQGLAFGIWLRWVQCEKSELRVWFEPAYCNALQLGLQHGDSERRKQCLAILRQSVAVGASDDSSMATISARQDGTIDRTEFIEQYERFCTVSEAILLGRYINQVVECEEDLNLLSSSASVVQVDWLYTILASALHPKIQDSNRKFIGNWIMRSRFQPDSAESYAVFLRSAFLPWATQGSLFTASLRHERGRLRCGHGERLAQYVRQLVERNADESMFVSHLLEALMDLLFAPRIFAYAAVYMQKGISNAVENVPHLQLILSKQERPVNHSLWKALPEVARDYCFVQGLKIFFGNPSPGDTGAARGGSNLQASPRSDPFQETLRMAAAADSAAGPIASWPAVTSKRDRAEKVAFRKAHDLRVELQSSSSLDPKHIDRLLEVWSDLESLQHPKRLLRCFPDLLLDSKLATMCVLSASLCTTVAHLVAKLQAMSRHRVYLVAPLLRALRQATLAVPKAATVLGTESVVMSYAERLPQPTVDLQLEDAAIYLLQDIAPEMRHFDYDYYFGPRETLGVAALLDLISRLGADCPEVLMSMFEKTLARWEKQRVPTPTVSSWKSTLQLQVLLLCCEQVLSHLEADSVLKRLHYILSIEPLPRHRYLLSWIIARIYLRHERFRAGLLSELATKDHHSNPKYLASLMKLGIMLVYAEDTTADFAVKLATTFVALSASSKVIVRHEAQWQVPLLMDLARARRWDDITHSVAFVALDEYIRSLERYEQPPLERQLDRFDPIKDHTLTNLVEGAWYGFDGTDAPLCRRSDFVRLYQDDAASARSWPSSCMPLGEPVTMPSEIDATATAIAQLSCADQSKEALVPSKAGGSRALQTKGTAYMASAIAAETDEGARRHDLIVVASLVDNPYNLGGLSRVSEVFGVSEMHLQNQNVTSNKDFQAVAVSSHLHLTLLQLSAPAVPDYLSMKRDDGWTIVGIEQTDRSVLLGSAACKLSKKTVLVLGSEKEGIPAVVLSECNMLVEIPQQGVTRSLNVQTAASTVLYEYSRQHRPAQS